MGGGAVVRECHPCDVLGLVSLGFLIMGCSPGLSQLPHSWTSLVVTHTEPEICSSVSMLLKNQLRDTAGIFGLLTCRSLRHVSIFEYLFLMACIVSQMLEGTVDLGVA